MRRAHLCVHHWDELAEIFVYRGMIWNNEQAGITNKKFENQWSNPSLLPPDSIKHKSFRQTHISSTTSLWEDRFHSLLFENFSVTDTIWLFVSGPASHPAAFVYLFFSYHRKWRPPGYHSWYNRPVWHITVTSNTIFCFHSMLLY